MIEVHGFKYLTKEEVQKKYNVTDEELAPMFKNKIL